MSIAHKNNVRSKIVCFKKVNFSLTNDIVNDTIGREINEIKLWPATKNITNKNIHGI